MAEYIEQEKAYELASDFAGQASTKTEYSAYWKVARAIKELPAADVVEVRHGEWKEIDNVAIEHGMLIAKGRTWRCGVCGEARKTLTKPNMNYCPNCGAKMDGERGEEK